MQIVETIIPEVKVVIPKVFGDSRGYFFESWNAGAFADAGINSSWVQDNESRSRKGVLRGLHYQTAPYTQAKLVRVIEGAVWDVVVDIRKNSPTFGRHVAMKLDAESKYQLFIPRGFAHGFVVLSESAVFAYKCDNFYMPSHERGIAFDDPDLGIDWHVDCKECILSDKDKRNPLFREAELLDYENKEPML